VQLSNAIFLDRKNRQDAIKEARQAAKDIHSRNVIGNQKYK
jgi:lysophosphatidate acyltransferase